MIKTESKTIGGVEYTVTQFPARRGLLIQTKLAKLIGPLLGGALAGIDLKKGAGADVNLEKALGSLATLDPDAFCTLALELLTCTRRAGIEITQGSFDLDFAGEYLNLYKVLLFSIEVNFSDFFGASGIGGLVARFQQAPKQSPAAPSPRP